MSALLVDWIQVAGVLIIIVTLVAVIAFLRGFIRRVSHLKTLGADGEARIHGELLSGPIVGLLGTLGLAFGRALLGL